LLEKNLDNVNWWNLSENPNAIQESVNNISLFDFNFIFFNVPLKNGKNLPLWVVNWLQGLITCGSKPELGIDNRLNIRGYYYSLIKNANIPKGSENKYQNTSAFVEAVINKHPVFSEMKRVGKEHDPLEKI